MSKGILISRATKIKLGKNCFTHPSLSNSNKFKVYRNIYNVVIRNAKKLHYERELRAAQSNLKKTWSILKNAINKPTTKSSNIESLNIDGVTVNDPIVLANALNEFFSKVAIQIAEDIHPVSPQQYDDDAHDDKPLLKFNEDPVTPSEILEALDSLQAKTSQDFNGLSMFLVKKLSYQLAKPLCHLFNLSFLQGVVPTQMKIAKIIPIHKGGDRSSMDNYRPISLLSCFSKILEKIVCKRLTLFLENNNLISNSQFGFRSSHSTIHPMIKFMNFVSEALNKKQHTIAIFCDL